MSAKPAAGYLVCTALVFMALTLSSCVTDPISYVAAPPIVHNALFEYPTFNDQPTGIAVSREGRVFVSFPRWDKDPLYSVAEVRSDVHCTPIPIPIGTVGERMKGSTPKPILSVFRVPLLMPATDFYRSVNESPRRKQRGIRNLS